MLYKFCTVNKILILFELVKGIIFCLLPNHDMVKFLCAHVYFEYINIINNSIKFTMLQCYLCEHIMSICIDCVRTCTAADTYVECAVPAAY